MNLFGNLFGNKLQEINIDTLDLKSTDPLVTRATYILESLGLRNSSDFVTQLNNVMTVIRRYQEVDVEASAANIKKVLIETPVVKEVKKDPKPKQKNIKKVESIVAPLTDTSATNSTTTPTKKSTKKSVYNRKSNKKNS